MTGPTLRLERAEVRCLRMPLVSGFETSFGRVAHREMLLVTLFAGGLAGWGEAPVADRPHFSAETSVTARHALCDHILPAVIGRSFASVDDFLAPFAWVRGHHMARAAAESAFRDLRAKARGVSLSSDLGAFADEVEVGVSLGIPEGERVSALVDEVARRLDEGYSRVKLKVKPGFDHAPIEAVRARFPALPLCADANGAYAEGDADHLRYADDGCLLFLEQPLAAGDLCGHARLAKRLATPICLDESLASPFDVEAAIALGACSIVNLKPGRVGGVRASLEIRDRCAARGIGLWCGGMLETGVGRAHNVALAATAGFTMAGDLSASDRYWLEDIVDPPFRLRPGSRLAVPRGAGIGVEVAVDRLARVTVATDVIAPSNSG